MQEGPRYLQPRTLQWVQYSPRREENSICVIVRRMTAAWRLKIAANARGEMSGRAYLGSVRVLPWRSGGDRVVAIACAPGAETWYVCGEPEDHAVTETPEVDFMGCPYLTSPGVRHIDGVSLPFARHVEKDSGVSGTAILLGPLTGFSCIAGPAGATVTFTQDGNSPTVITVPPGASYSESFEESAGIVDTLAFVGTVSYSATYLVQGDGLDVI